jgi:hypothetical protein
MPSLSERVEEINQGFYGSMEGQYSILGVSKHWKPRQNCGAKMKIRM